MELCRSAGATVLVDDSLKYVAQCAGQLSTVVLFGDYQWNRRLTGEPLPPGAYRSHNWVHLKGVLQRLRKDGRLMPQDSVSCTLRHKADFYANSARWVLENQPSVHLTGVGASIATLVRTVEALQRTGDVTVASLRSGVDAAAPGRDRQPRLTALVHRCDSLLEKLVTVANETPRYRSARAALDAARSATAPVVLDPAAPTIGTLPGMVCAQAQQGLPRGNLLAGALIGGAAAAAKSAAAR